MNQSRRKPTSLIFQRNQLDFSSNSSLRSRSESQRSLKLSYRPIIRQYKKRVVDKKTKIAVNNKEALMLTEMSASRNFRSRKDWTVTDRRIKSNTYHSSLEDMIDSSLKEVKQLKPLAFGEEYREHAIEEPKKNRWKIFVCLLLTALLVIIPIVGTTLYYFVSCYQNISLDLGPNIGLEVPSSLSNLTPVLSRNNVQDNLEFPQNIQENNITKVLQNDNYDPFFHTRQKLTSKEELSKSLNGTEKLNHNGVCILNYVVLMLSIMFGIVILVFVLGYSFS